MADPVVWRESSGDVWRRQALETHSYAALRFADLAALEGKELWRQINSTDSAFPLILEEIDPDPGDTVLDVGCGPGIMTCQLATFTQHATGVDLTAAMLDMARRLQISGGTDNASFVQAEVPPIPMRDDAFSIVITRLCLHHLRSPAKAVMEMARVCTPGGRVVIVDEVVPPGNRLGTAYNEWESLRDPSHVRFMTLEELRDYVAAAGLVPKSFRFFTRELDLDEVLANSVPRAGFDDVMEQLRSRALAEGVLYGLSESDGRLRFNTVDAVIVGEKEYE